MRIGSMTREEWVKFAPFVDTLCLPIYSLSIVEKEIFSQEAKYIEQVMAKLEEKLTGRLLLLPSIPYIGGNREVFISYLEEVVHEFLQSGFHHIILVTSKPYADMLEIASLKKEGIHTYILTESEHFTEEEKEEEVERLYDQVVEFWQSESFR